MDANAEMLNPPDNPRFRDNVGFSITCDRCGRWQRLGAPPIVAAMQRAAASGWIKSAGKDLCPLCALSEVNYVRPVSAPT